jgi:hypothetical protein
VSTGSGKRAAGRPTNRRLRKRVARLHQNVAQKCRPEVLNAQELTNVVENRHMTAVGSEKSFLVRPRESLRTSQNLIGGESGIRTHGRVSPTHAFQACAIDHSAISPFRINNLRSRLNWVNANCVTPPNVARSLTGARPASNAPSAFSIALVQPSVRSSATQASPGSR